MKNLTDSFSFLKRRGLSKERLTILVVFAIAVAARLGWLVLVPPSGDSLKYWAWAKHLGSGTAGNFPHGPYWTVSYPWILWLLSFGQTLNLTTTAMIQAALQAAIVIPMAQMLKLLHFRHYAITIGALGVAISPYTAFAGGRPLGDPLATFLWWTGLLQIIILLRSPAKGWRWWLLFTLSAMSIGLAAHLRLPMLPAIGISCLCLLLLAFRSTGSLRLAAGMATILLLASVPALWTTRSLRDGVDRWIEDVHRLQMSIWMSTHYLGYDRFYPANASLPWDGRDPRPYLPSGWQERSDGPAANALIEEALNGAAPDSIGRSFMQLGQTWRAQHPIAYHLKLPLLRIVAAWVPLSPELWVRVTPHRIGHFFERVLTLIGFVVLARWTFAGGCGDRRRVAATIWISAFSLPTLTVLAVHVWGLELSEYRAHHAGWLPPLSVGVAWLAEVAYRWIYPAMQRVKMSTNP